MVFQVFEFFWKSYCILKYSRISLTIHLPLCSISCGTVVFCTCCFYVHVRSWKKIIGVTLPSMVTCYFLCYLVWLLWAGLTVFLFETYCTLFLSNINFIQNALSLFYFRIETLNKEKVEAVAEVQERVASLETQKSFQSQKFKVNFFSYAHFVSVTWSGKLFFLSLRFSLSQRTPVM